MKLHELHPNAGSRRPRRRVGRGDSSGIGGTCGRGEKGQKSRSGATSRPFFEGGQIPLFRRLPKRGFNHPSHKVYSIVNVGMLDKMFEVGDVIDEAALKAKGIVGKSNQEIKILGNGELTKELTIKAHKFSGAAKSKVEAVGGKCELLS